MTTRQPRDAQRRRTRAAIVEAATRLVTAGATPSVDDIAAAADVSRRTVYLYFPTLDQLLLDATTGALSAATVETVLVSDSGGAVERVDGLVTAMARTAGTTLPLGRKIIALTVDNGGEGQRRGYRRVEWIERAVDPLREDLTPAQRERLVAALSLVVGWEAMVVLRDVMGLEPAAEEEVLRWAATSLVQAMTAEAVKGNTSSRVASTGRRHEIAPVPLEPLCPSSSPDRSPPTT